MLAMLLAVSIAIPDISFIDSKDDPKVTYLVIDNCVLKLAKSELNNLKDIEQKVDNKCHLNVKLKDLYVR